MRQPESQQTRMLQSQSSAIQPDQAAVERMKDEFVSVVSHELRTPLTSIRGALGLLAGGRLGEIPEKAQRMLEIAVSNTDRLARLVNAILDIERIEAGKVILQRELRVSSTLVAEAVELMRPLAEKTNIRLEFRSCDTPICADNDQVIQVIANLVDNAIKFSDAGTTVTISATDTPTSVRFEVADQGCGIPPDMLDAVFERFQQVDASDSRRSNGPGLGLAICRGIVRAHGGEIAVESGLGRGSCFRFTIPRPATSEVNDVSPDVAPTILLCDADDPARDALARTIESHDYLVIPFASGGELLDYKSISDVSAILIALSTFDGWETLATLKRNRDTERIPVIVLSACGRKRTAYPEAIAGWLQTPLDECALWETLEQIVDRERSPTNLEMRVMPSQ